MRSFLIILSCFSVVLFPRVRTEAQHISSYHPPLYYDRATGNLTMDVTEVPGGVISGYNLRSNFDEMFLPQNYTPFLNTVFTSASGGEVGEVNFAGVPAGVYSVGDVLPPNFTEEELRAVFENPSTFWGVPNLNLLGQVGTGEGHAFNLVFSPTPLRPLNIDSDVPFHDRWATEVLLAYDARDGSLELDTTGPSGGAMTVYEIEANSNFFAADAFHPIFGTVFEADGRHLTETGFGGIPEGVYNLGPVLPPDLSWDQLDTMLNVAHFIGHPGHSGLIDVNAVGVAMNISVVPEPSSLTLLLATLICICRRSKR